MKKTPPSAPADKPSENCSVCEIRFSQKRGPGSWTSRIFDAMGLVFIAVSFVLFFISWMTDDTKFYIALCVSFFISGLLYTAAGEILRSTNETAHNSSKIVELLEIMLADKHDH